jgi:hypothetical protein
LSGCDGRKYQAVPGLGSMNRNSESCKCWTAQHGHVKPNIECGETTCLQKPA